MKGDENIVDGDPVRFPGAEGIDELKPGDSEELWFVAGPRRPVRIGGDGSLLYATSNGMGWAVDREPIPASAVAAPEALSLNRADAASTVGGLLYSLAYRLEYVGVRLPASLLDATTTNPAAVVGATGRPSLLAVNGTLCFATEWDFDGYRAAVTVFGRAWVGVLAPSNMDLALESTSDYRPMTW